MPMQFETYFRAHYARVHRLALIYGGRHHGWAEDVAQEVFIKLRNNMHQLGPDDVGKWLYRVTVNQCLSALRRERTWARVVRSLLPSQEPLVDTASEVELSAEAAAVRRTLEKMPPLERIVLTMVCIDERSQKETADVLQLSEGYISKLIAAGRARFAKLHLSAEPLNAVATADNKQGAP